MEFLLTESWPGDGGVIFSREQARTYGDSRLYSPGGGDSEIIVGRTQTKILWDNRW